MENKDRIFFKKRLYTNFNFAIKHIPSLYNRLVGRFNNLLLRHVNTRHKGNKKWPIWLSKKNILIKKIRSENLNYLNINLINFTANYSYKKMNVLLENSFCNAWVKDQEIMLRDSRWAFLNESLLDGNQNSDIQIQKIIKWIDLHIDSKGKLWDTYSACERVVNLIIYLSKFPEIADHQMIKRRIKEFIQKSLIHIVSHLEFYGEKTGNHIINNARAIMAGGVFLQSITYQEIAFKILQNTAPLLISENGFLRERSSHYQLIICNWLLDIENFILSSTQISTINVEFQLLIEKVKNASRLMLINNFQLLGLIGDICPDLSPTNSLNRIALLYPKFLHMEIREVGDTLLDGWFRLEKFDSVVFGYFENGLSPKNYYHHGHNDSGSFIWSHRNQLILADPGRFSYSDDPISLWQISGDAHNSVQINGYQMMSESFIDSAQWWPTPYATTHNEVNLFGNHIRLSHDGFKRATPIELHTRDINISENQLSVIDIFQPNPSAIDLKFKWNFGNDFFLFDKESKIAQSTLMKVRVDLYGPNGTLMPNEYHIIVSNNHNSLEYGVLNTHLSIDVLLKSTSHKFVKTIFTIMQ